MSIGHPRTEQCSVRPTARAVGLSARPRRPEGWLHLSSEHRQDRVVTTDVQLHLQSDARCCPTALLTQLVIPATPPRTASARWLIYRRRNHGDDRLLSVPPAGA